MALKYLQDNSHRLFSGIIVCLLLVGCSVDNTSREDALRQVIEDIQAAADGRKLNDMMDHVSDDYADVNGQTQDSVRRVVQVQFIRYPKIYTFKSITNLVVHDDDNASVTLLVAVAGQPIESASALLGLSADLLRFDLTFVYDEQWEVASAEWGSAQASDFIQ